MLFVCLSLCSCGGPKSATPPGNSQNATVHAAQPARAAPSASAKMICAPETQTELAAVLGVQTTRPVVPTWTDHLYSCRYTYHNAFIVLSVKELSGKGETDGYFTSLAARPDPATPAPRSGRLLHHQEPLGRQGPSRRYLRAARPVWCAALQPRGHRDQGRRNDHGLLERRLITPQV